jgi:hypothetical protein
MFIKYYMREGRILKNKYDDHTFFLLNAFLRAYRDLFNPSEIISSEL